MTSLDVSTAADLQPAAEVLAELCGYADRCGAPIMVVGAAARDILIRHLAGAPPARATADIDIAVAVASWPELSRLTDGLRPAPRTVHTYLVRGIEVDVIPFGGIESAGRTVTWSNDHRMDVLGFREALAAAVEVTLPGGVVVRVASLPAQSVLKLLAWRDRRYDTRRDAIDLRTILDAYHQGPYLDELYDEYGALLERYGFDPALAGADRMGNEAGALLAESDRRTVAGVLGDEDLYEALVGDMGTSLDRNREMLAAYRSGVRR